MTADTHADTGDGAAKARAGRVQQQLRGGARHAVAGMEHGLARGGDILWRAFKRRPALGVTTATVLGLGVASAIGASELAVGIAAGVAAYQMLKNNEPPSKALDEAARFGL